jgi:hypothetical protein
MIVHVWTDKVTAIRENIITVSGRKEGDKAIIETEQRGWLVCFGNVSFQFAEKPEFETGELIRFTMEKALEEMPCTTSP